LNYFVADFYCDQKKAVIELDGSIHDNSQEYDQFRDDEMKEKGIHVLRLSNNELLNMTEALQKIIAFLNAIS
jgi:very-short-patch-repair endonuclease